MTIEEKLSGRYNPAEAQFILDMRCAAKRGVGYGFMQQVIEWEWQSKGPGAWGPEYFEQRIRELETKNGKD
jgi:hypothetical protein